MNRRLTLVVLVAALTAAIVTPAFGNSAEVRERMMVRDWNPCLGKGLGPDPREDYEPASYYAAELGQRQRRPKAQLRGLLRAA